MADSRLLQLALVLKGVGRADQRTAVIKRGRKVWETLRVAGNSFPLLSALALSRSPAHGLEEGGRLAAACRSSPTWKEGGRFVRSRLPGCAAGGLGRSGQRGEGARGKKHARALTRLAGGRGANEGRQHSARGGSSTVLGAGAKGARSSAAAFSSWIQAIAPTYH